MENKKLSNQLKLIEKYDEACIQLKEEFKDDEIVLEEKLNELRSKLLVFLEPSLNQVDNIEKAYEYALYDALKDQIKRSYAYYKAIERHKKDLKDFNDAIGERVLEFDSEKTENILNKFDEIYFIKVLASGLGIMPEDAQKIIDLVIAKSFSKKDK